MHSLNPENWKKLNVNFILKARVFIASFLQASLEIN